MRVLLAEDEPTIVVTLRDALEDAGHTVLHAADTQSALELVETGEPECVLTDVRMPGAGGMAVLERSVALDPRRPVVMMTGFGSPAQESEALRIGAAHFVRKPFRNDAIVQMLAALSLAGDVRARQRRP